jgi:ClpP class serine protease
MDITKTAIRGTTQEFVQIADIREDLVFLIDGSVALIIKVAAVNFGLLSEKEQEAIIFAYAEFLNSLNFAVQIVVRSQRKDISSYINKLTAQQQEQKNELLNRQIESYKNFILSTVKENNVLDKKFYLVIPFSSLELGATTASKSLFKKITTLPMPIEKIAESAKNALYPKRDHALRQLGRVGLRAKQATTAELIDLFYEAYNPDKKSEEKPEEKFENLKS